jgi:beta-phosphoglucomutase
MQWIHHYNLFLFDFDGLLVNTEFLHFEAYKRMCQSRGHTLAWDFPRYCLAAHYEATGLRDQVYAEFPQLQSQEPDWDVLYQEKKQHFIDILLADPVPLMPGVQLLLDQIQKADIPRVVVTHSAGELVNLIREKNPVLNSIPHWITREDYKQPKPNSECYNKAIEVYAKEGDAVIGFEDSPRGMTALLGSTAKPVLICPPEHPGCLKFSSHPAITFFPSFEAIQDRSL